MILNVFLKKDTDWSPISNSTYIPSNVEVLIFSIVCIIIAAIFFLLDRVRQKKYKLMGYKKDEDFHVYKILSFISRNILNIFGTIFILAGVLLLITSISALTGI